MKIDLKSLIGGTIISVDKNFPIIDIKGLDGKKYQITPDCEDSQSATWFDVCEFD